MEEKENEEESEVLFYLAKHEGGADQGYNRPFIEPFANKLDNVKIDIQNLVKGPDIRVIDGPDGI